MKWEVIARIRCSAETIFNLSMNRPPRERFQWIAFFLGPRRQIKCGCGRVWIDRPHEAALPEGADTCKHIKALYGNGSYVDEIDNGPLRGMLNRGVVTLGPVKLTPLGKEMFEWRYAALALK